MSSSLVLPTSQLPISVLIITDRLDERLKRCLESVQFAGEIILIIYHPALTPPAWVRDLTTQVVEKRAALTSFGAARNQALKLAAHDWVLFLDSDEQLLAATLTDLPALLTDPSVAGVSMIRKDMFHGQILQWGEVGRVRLVRLARKDALHFERPVHEVAVVRGRVVDSQLTLLHNSHASVSEFLQAVANYAFREASFRHEKGEKFEWWQLVIYPLAKWLVNVVLKGGFLDGWRGLSYAYLMSIHSALVRVYLYELDNLS